MYNLKIDKSIPFKFKANITTENGTTINITGDDVKQVSLNSDSCESSNISLGFASGSSFNIDLFNQNGEFDDYILKNATLVPFVIANNVDEIPIGIFNIEVAINKDGILTLETMDKMVNFDVKWGGFTPPKTAKELLKVLCEQCKVECVTETFLNDDFIIKTNEGLVGMSCRQVLSLLCEITGNFAFINRYGKLELKWYDRELICEEFLYENMKKFTREENTVQITGISVYMNDAEEYSFGDNWYELTLTENNALLLDQEPIKINAVIEPIYRRKLMQMNYLPCNFEIGYNPLLDIGDTVKVEDVKGNKYIAFITNIDIKDFNNMIINSTGKSKNENNRYTGTGGSGSGGNNEKQVDIKFMADRNVSEYSIIQNTTQVINSLFVGVSDETKLQLGYTISYEVSEDTNVLFELIVNQGSSVVEMYWSVISLKGKNSFSFLYTPKPLKNAGTFFDIRATTGNSTMNIKPEFSILSANAKNAEGQEVPKYPEANITENFSPIIIAPRPINKISVLDETILIGDNGIFSRNIIEEFNSIRVVRSTINICEEKINGTTYGELGNYKHELLSTKTHQQLHDGN